MDLLLNAGEWTLLDPPLSKTTLDAIEQLGFNSMTPVQASSIPLFMKKKDVVVEAVTGSGKTLAFLIPILEILTRREEVLRKHQVGAIVISPTRELARQIHDVLETILVKLDDRQITTMLITGGGPVSDEMAQFQKNGSHIVIATPGKLQDLLEKYPDFNVKELEVLVLDEADRLLDLGFEKSLKTILGKLPKQRRTGLFSATMTDALSDLVKAGLRNPVRVVVKVEDKTTQMVQRIPASLEVYYSLIDPDQKLEYLMRCLLDAYAKNEKVIVYFATCHCVDYFTKILALISIMKDIPMFSLHGKMKSQKRPNVYRKFIESPNGVLLCTDVAARGLDLPDVDFVIQFDPPQDPQAFLHRCGRTARQGRQGRAVVFLSPHEDTYLNFLELRKVPLRGAFPTPPPLPSLPPSAFPIPSSPTSTLPTAPIKPPFTMKNLPSPLPTPPLPPLFETIQSYLVTDRSLLELSTDAYLSFLRYYENHTLSYIFPVQMVDMDKYAILFGLVKMPKFKGKFKVGKNANVEDGGAKSGEEKERRWWERWTREVIANIGYRDKKREKERREAMKEAERKREEEGEKKVKRKITGAWSQQKEMKQKRQERREKKQRKRDAIEAKQTQEVMGRVLKKSRAADEDDEDNWDDLARETRLLKKLKSGKITQEEFDEMVGENDFE